MAKPKPLLKNNPLTDPLFYDSSGSEHSAAGDDDDHSSSLSLSELVRSFLENETQSPSQATDLDDSARVDPVDDVTIADIQRLSSNNNVVDPYRNVLSTHVSEAMNKFAFLRTKNVSIFNRNVMQFLRDKGHNAAICKTKWDSSSSSNGGVTAGNYQFIDVVSSSTWQNHHRRYFVDLDFSSQFQIARPTARYTNILCTLLPDVFVGTEEELKRSVSFMCDAAKRCFRSMGLSVPPWRKNRYMQNKWFGSYRRTTNPVQGNPVQVVVSEVTGPNCRFVGFDDVVSEAIPGGVFVRTR